MARTDTLINFFTDVADAIRSKTGKSEPIACENFDTEIESISGGGGDIPEAGVAFSDWDSDGYPHTAQYVGRNTVGSCYFQAASSGSLGLTYKLEKITLPTTLTNINTGAFMYLKNLANINLVDTNLTTIGTDAFSNCNNLELESLPDTVTSIGGSAFMNCTKLALKELPTNLVTLNGSAFYSTSIAIKTLPNGVTSLLGNTFARCSKISQLSMPKVKSIASANNGGAFYSTSIYGMWIGNQLTTINRYSLQGSGSTIKRVFIDLPRATVEALAGYSYAFMNDTTKTGIIICNDDSDFMSQSEFDAIDWKTYTV